MAIEYTFAGKKQVFVAIDYSSVGVWCDSVEKGYTFVEIEYTFMGKKQIFVAIEYTFVGKKQVFVAIDYTYVGVWCDSVAKRNTFAAKNIILWEIYCFIWDWR